MKPSQFQNFCRCDVLIGVLLGYRDPKEFPFHHSGIGNADAAIQLGESLYVPPTPIGAALWAARPHRRTQAHDVCSEPPGEGGQEGVSEQRALPRGSRPHISRRRSLANCSDAIRDRRTMGGNSWHSTLGNAPATLSIADDTKYGCTVEIERRCSI